MSLSSLLLVFLSYSWYGVEGGHTVSKKLQMHDEYDCVDIYKQPAFDNILLKNHKIQMNPSSLPKFKSNNKLLYDRDRNFQLQSSNGCPEGTVPIQRSRVNNHADLKAISKLHLGNIDPLTSTNPGRHFAVFQSRLKKPGTYGARAMINLNNPPVKMNQVSMSQIWLEGGPPAELNSIQFGWAVNPRLYGDNITRATAYWTADAYQRTGCYNYMCPGFVQVHREIYLGFRYDTVSTIGGPMYETQPMIYKHDEYDCVDIYKQPAFDNILLKNHKIQMNPSSLPKFKSNNKLLYDRDRNFQLQSSNGCPEGTVPIQRSRVNNHADLKAISKLHLGNIDPLTSTNPGRHFAVFQSRLKKPGTYGARAMINLNNPPVKMNQVSMSQIWLEGGPPAELNSIQFGWAVNPRLYGDNITRATAYWTADAYQRTGCYNYMCPGFVQVHREIYLGFRYYTVSTIGGPMYETQPMIYKDPETGNWWLFLGSGSKVGYWPKEIIPHLSVAATTVRYGGWTYNSPDGLSPPMGNGRFPSFKFHYTGWFAQIQTVNKFNNLVDLEKDSVEKIVDNTSCYDAIHWGNLGRNFAETFSYGGPGGMCGI